MDWLMPAIDIDDAESPHAESNAVREVVAGVVRSAMNHRVAHCAHFFLDNGLSIEIKNSGNSAHKAPIKSTSRTGREAWQRAARAPVFRLQSTFQTRERECCKQSRTSCRRSSRAAAAAGPALHSTMRQEVPPSCIQARSFRDVSTGAFEKMSLAAAAWF